MRSGYQLAARKVRLRTTGLQPKMKSSSQASHWVLAKNLHRDKRLVRGESLERRSRKPHDGARHGRGDKREAAKHDVVVGWLALLSSALVLDGFDFDEIGEYF